MPVRFVHVDGMVIKSWYPEPTEEEQEEIEKAWSPQARAAAAAARRARSRSKGSSLGKKLIGAAAGTIRNIGTAVSAPVSAASALNRAAHRAISLPIDAIHSVRTGLYKLQGYNEFGQKIKKKRK